VLAQIELFTNHGKYENKVYVLPKHLDEKVAALHLDKLGVNLTALSAAQADYLNPPRSGPFKREHYPLTRLGLGLGEPRLQPQLVGENSAVLLWTVGP
jgi:hypothetical protein